MENWFHPADRAALLERLRRLSPDSRGRWGSMTAHEAVCHLADPVRVALGEKQAPVLATPLCWPGISWLMVWVMPWPRSAPTAPEFVPGKGMTQPTEFQADVRDLVELLQRFTDFPGTRPFAPSPVFGRLDRMGWGRLMWRHVEHHLRQFGA